jgi:hypothetical protein
MAETTPKPAIQCPKCKSAYRLPPGFKGKATCKKCGAAFLVGVSDSERRSSKAREERDQRAVKQLLIVGAIVLVAVGGLIAFLGSRPGGPPPDTGPILVPPSRPSDSSPARPLISSLSTQPEKIARAFLAGLARGDRSAIARHFDVDSYYAWWDGDNMNRTPPAERYANLPPEEQARKRELVFEQLLDPEMANALATSFLPSLEAGDPKWSRPPVIQRDHGVFDVQCRDAANKPLLSLSITSKLRQGRTLPEDLEVPEAWGIYRVDSLWHQSTLKVPKADRRAVDSIEGRLRERERREAASRPRGPVEADAATVPELPGTGPAQVEAIQKAIATLLDPAARGPDYHNARDQLVHLGKTAIPALLNLLVGKNHIDGEEDIKTSFVVIQVLDEITGQGTFGYGPTPARTSGVGITTATGEERVRAVRRWFGWWSRNKDTFTKRAPPPEEEPPR